MLNLEALLGRAPLGNDQRNDRALVLVTTILQGQASSTHGTEGVGQDVPWAHTMGAFRFWNNPQILLPALYQPCREGLAELLPKGTRVYVAHDLSDIDYSTHYAKLDTVQVGNERGKGYELYSAMILGEQGQPLGPLSGPLK